MIAKNHRAFTLIEMLIVVAIISILAIGMIAYITVPPREQMQATVDMENEMGLSAFFAKLVTDAHNAAGLTITQNKKGLILEDSGKDVSAVYFIDRNDHLRRCLMTRQQTAELADATDDINVTLPSILLVGNVRRFETIPEEKSELWRVRVSIATQDPLHPTLDRSIKLSIGNPMVHSAEARTKRSDAINTHSLMD